ncbi:MAG: hypothetical protein K0Q84_1229, partial [Arthrobacter sp.]|nr:hypothetical protein [Arthrobacter sp.]
QQRSVKAAVPREDVVIELGYGAGGLTPGLLRIRQGKRQRGGGQITPHFLQQRYGCKGTGTARRRAPLIMRFVLLVPGGHRNIMPVHGLSR